MTMSKKYWKGLPELTESPEFLQNKNNEFVEPLPLEEVLSSKESDNEGTSRRDFLKVMGFSTAAVALAACETPVNKAIPYVVKPEEITPGVANFYASTFYDGHDYASILVKTREGRPIRIVGNELSKINKTGLSARIQSSVLSLYDSARLKYPYIKGEPSTWKNTDAAVTTALKKGNIVILTSTIISPSTKAVIAEFSTKYPGTKVVTYDSISYSALSKANKNVFGKSVISSYDFSKAKTLVGIACDFMGNWLSPVEFGSQYGHTRAVTRENPVMSKHYHFEANLSLSGANADERYMVKPSEYGKVAVALFNEIASATGNSRVSADSKLSNDAAAKAISKIAKSLLSHKGQSLVVAGSNDENIQTLVNGINKMLDNYGKTVDVENHFLLKQGDDKEFINLVADLNAGRVSTLITYNCNPIYTAPAALNFEAAYKKAAVKISLSQVLDETAKLADIVCPDHNFLESWGDANPKRGFYSLQQPTINPIFAQPRHEGSRQAQDSFLTWAGVKTDYLAYLQAYWNNHLFPQQGKFGDFPSFWAQTLHDGILRVAIVKEAPFVPAKIDSAGRPIMEGVAAINLANVSDSIINTNVQDKVAETIASEEGTNPFVDYNKMASAAVASKGGQFELAIYEKIGLGNGNQSNNPWLMELPDPISKVTWDNYITMAPADVKSLGLNKMLRQDIIGSVVDLTVNGTTVKIPVYPQPGQAPGTIGIALGYGRNAESLKVAHGVGVNAFPFVSNINGSFQNVVYNVTVSKHIDEHKFSSTQIQHTIMGREEYLLREVSLNEYKNKPQDVWNPAVVLPTHEGNKPIAKIDLWDEFPRMNHKWGMTIDLSTCIGCAACVIACQVENNVAVVGKLEVSRVRDMAWLRIDRYYTSDVTKETAQANGLVETRDMYLDMETPSHNPKVTFQPMMCQHCNHAPCETVCPVLATSHSSEGLNMMTYNRCIGTRYCANNCPFKVRRFNWFNYNGNELFADVNPAQQDLGRMVLNPDVVVRSRGVMEKCTMCVQTIQAGKLSAKKAGRPVADGEIKTACQSACPTHAISFGDLNDADSKISEIRKDDKNFFLLEDIGVKPTVSYLLKVRNQDEEMHAHHEKKIVTEAKTEKHS